VAAHVGDVFQHRFLLLHLRRGEGGNGLLRRRGGGFAQLADELLSGGVVFKDVGKRAVGRFFLFNIRFRRGRTLLGGGVPVVTPGIATANDGALNRLINSNRIHGTASSGENVEQNDKYRSRGGGGFLGTIWRKKAGQPGPA
jgi:hypothetical protein